MDVTSSRYLKAMLTAIALLLAAILLRLITATGTLSGFRLIPLAQAHRMVQQMSNDVLFFPVGNQDVRKWVFFDRRTNTIYKYDGGGGFEDAWQVGNLGERLKRVK